MGLFLQEENASQLTFFFSDHAASLPYGVLNVIVRNHMMTGDNKCIYPNQHKQFLLLVRLQGA